MFTVATAIKIPIHNYAAKLIYCDPPSNRGMNEGNSSDVLPSDDYHNFCLQWLREASRCMSGNSWLVICLYHKNRFIFQKIIDNPLSGLYDLRYDHEVIWDYSFGRYTNNRFVPSHDNILLYKKGKPPFNWRSVTVPSQRMLVGDKRADWRGRTPSSVWSIPRTPGNSLDRKYMVDTYKRSCQPIELCTRFLLALTEPGDLVLDLFSGSGSMGMACKETQRLYWGMDICKEYLKESKERLEKEPERLFMKN